MTEKKEYCIIVPTEGLLSMIVWTLVLGKKVCFLHFSYALWAYGRQFGDHMQ